ncbi:hypothetical protein [Streptomyces sp. NPDC059262]|uniref:hypothetical protein n=1 Tax=Streptomyces sp. NPDC059262 TaxID=3346797 RepID=UPI0036C37607
MSPTRTRPALVVLGAAVLLTASVAVPQASAVGRASTALAWYDATAEAIATAGASTQITNSRTWAVSWLAATRATRSVPRASIAAPTRRRRSPGPYTARW